MGGFHLFQRDLKETNHNATNVAFQEDDVPLHPLSVQDLYGYTTIDIDFSSFTLPTEAEIKDRGKSDWLAKSLVLVQTSWFVIQCIARAIEHLPVTHLEIVTLAYAAMNFVIYIFWWNKPLNVNRPVRVFRKPDSGATDNGTEAHGSAESTPNETQSQVNEPIPEAQKLTWDTFISGLGMILAYIAGGQDGDVNLAREEKVPRFWADSTNDEEVTADVIVLVVGVCFGAIHCIAWVFSFPTHGELLMWRVSSIAITAVPIYIPLMLGVATWLSGMDFEYFVVAVVSSVLPAGIVYIIARAVTLVLAFTSLRDLPPGAYETVYWTTFIPHV